MTQNKIKIGIIGGSGLDDPKLLTNFKKISVDTPYGSPSDKITQGTIGSKSVFILPRHGSKHTLSPTLIPYRANIWALKSLGCTHILATTACGSLNKNLKPGDLVFIDQFIDFTKLRKLTFFENEVIHTSMSKPFDQDLRDSLIKSAQKLKFSYHSKGTMITIEGPRFSTRAESLMFQQWGADLINMSTVPEVSLANELEIPYQSIAMVTDYDCWLESEEPVTFELIIKTMNKNSQKVKQLLVETITNL